MKYKIIISSYVWDSLEKMINFYLTINNHYAEKLIDSFLKRIKRIEQNPYMYKTLLYHPEYRYSVIMNNFLLVYKVVNGEIRVLYFVDGSTDYSSIIK